MKSKQKYGNRKVTVDGIEFDSAKEARRYEELKLLQRAGKISGLELQREFELLPAQYEEVSREEYVASKGKKTKGKCFERAVKYKADFVYLKDGKVIVEDVKGYRDPASAGYAKFVLKRKMLLYFYGIKIKEI